MKRKRRRRRIIINQERRKNQQILLKNSLKNLLQKAQITAVSINLETMNNLTWIEYLKRLNRLQNGL